MDDALDESDDDSLAAGLVELNSISNKSSGVDTSEREISESEGSSSAEEDNGATSFGSASAGRSGVMKFLEPDENYDEASGSDASSVSVGLIVPKKSPDTALLGDDMWKFDNNPKKKRESSGGALAELENSNYKITKKGNNSASGANISAKKNKRPLSSDEQPKKKKTKK